MLTGATTSHKDVNNSTLAIMLERSKWKLLKQTLLFWLSNLLHYNRHNRVRSIEYSEVGWHLGENKAGSRPLPLLPKGAVLRFFLPVLQLANRAGNWLFEIHLGVTKNIFIDETLAN